MVVMVVCVWVLMCVGVVVVLCIEVKACRWVVVREEHFKIIPVDCHWAVSLMLM